jgi:hypothetical protein
MTRLLLALGAVLGAVMLAACATPGGGTAGPGQGAVSSGPFPTPVPTSGGLPPAMQPTTLQPDPRAVDLRPARWTRTDGTGRHVTVYFTISGRPACSVLGRVEVAETAQTVTVTLLLGRLPDVDCSGPQPMLAAEVTTIVTLNEPLGTRQVRDGAPG